MLGLRWQQRLRTLERFVEAVICLYGGDKIISFLFKCKQF